MTDIDRAADRRDTLIAAAVAATVGFAAILYALAVSAVRAVRDERRAQPSIFQVEVEIEGS